MEISDDDYYKIKGVLAHYEVLKNDMVRLSHMDVEMANDIRILTKRIEKLQKRMEAIES